MANIAKRAVAWSFCGAPSPTDPVIWWKVEPLDGVFIRGFNVARPGQREYWRIGNRKENYESAEQAMSVLQAETDHVHNQC